MQICKLLKRIITILLLCVLASHISETFLKKSFYIEITQDIENESCMKKAVEKKDMKDLVCNSIFHTSMDASAIRVFSITIIADLTAPVIENVVPPPNA